MNENRGSCERCSRLAKALESMLAAYAWNADITAMDEGEQALHSAVREARAALRSAP